MKPQIFAPGHVLKDWQAFEHYLPRCKHNQRSQTVAEKLNFSRYPNYSQLSTRG